MDSEINQLIPSLLPPTLPMESPTTKALRELLDQLIRSATDVIAKAEALEKALEGLNNDNQSGEQE